MNELQTVKFEQESTSTLLYISMYYHTKKQSSTDSYSLVHWLSCVLNLCFRSNIAMYICHMTMHLFIHQY